MRRQNYPFLPSCKASPPIGWYQIILLGDRGTCVLTTCTGLHSTAGGQDSNSRPVDCKSNVPTTRPPSDAARLAGSKLKQKVNHFVNNKWIVNCAKEGVFYMAFVCVFVCPLAASHKNCWLDLHANFTGDVSLDKEVAVKFWISSGSGFVSGNLLKEFYHCGILAMLKSRRLGLSISQKICSLVDLRLNDLPW